MISEKSFKNIKNVVKIIFIVFIVFNVFMLLSQIAFAAPTVKDGASTVSNIVSAISPWFNSLCVLGVGISIFELMCTTDQKKVNGAYAFVKLVLITFLIFNCLGSIFTYADGLNIGHTYNFGEESTFSDIMKDKKAELDSDIVTTTSATTTASGQIV